MLQSPQLRIPPVSVGTMLCLNHVVRWCSPQPTLLLWMGVFTPRSPKLTPSLSALLQLVLCVGEEVRRPNLIILSIAFLAVSVKLVLALAQASNPAWCVVVGGGDGGVFAFCLPGRLSADPRAAHPPPCCRSPQAGCECCCGLAQRRCRTPGNAVHAQLHATNFYPKPIFPAGHALPHSAGTCTAWYRRNASALCVVRPWLQFTLLTCNHHHRPPAVRQF